jgi:sporulation protein YlmC with PRC-barrel domain
MRLSDLLDAEVFDADNNKIGRVHEVRAVKDGPIQGAFGAALRLDGLIVGKGSVGTRLGLDRTDVGRPLALRWIFGGLSGETRYVRWDQVAAITDDRIILGVQTRELSQPERLSSLEQVDTPPTGG